MEYRNLSQYLPQLKVPLEDLQQASNLLIRALHIRECYMANSRQSFPSMTSRFLRSVSTGTPKHKADIQHGDRKTIEGIYLLFFFSNI